MGDILQKLRDLTSHLPEFPCPIDEDSSGKYSEYKMEKGECFSWFIHRSANDIAVHRWFCSKGTVFPEHTHREREWIIIYRGTMVMHKGGEKITLHKGDFIVNEPGISHSSTYPSDCRFLTIMVPPSPDFPKGDPKSWNDTKQT